MTGNYVADALADRAASHCQATVQEAAKVMWAKSLVKKIQQRAVAAILAQGTRTKSQKEQLHKPPTQQAVAALASAHQLEELAAGSYWCSCCLTFSPRQLRSRLSWLRQPCESRIFLQATLEKSKVQHQAVHATAELPLVLAGRFQAHHTHKLGVYKGLYYCESCGAYGSHRPRRLMKKCEPPLPEASQHWSYAVDRIKAGNLPSGLPKWPDEDIHSHSHGKGTGSGAAHTTGKAAATGGADYQVPATVQEKKARRRHLKEQGRRGEQATEFHEWLRLRRSEPGYDLTAAMQLPGAKRSKSRPLLPVSKTPARGSKTGRQASASAAAARLPSGGGLGSGSASPAAGSPPAASGSSGSGTLPAQHLQQPTPEEAAAEQELAGDWPGLWELLEKEIFGGGGDTQSGGSSGAATSKQPKEPSSLEVMQEMVELADSGCRVHWPPELSLATARRLIEEQQQPQRAVPAAEPEHEPEFVFSSQELEAELGAQLELEGWL
jgi:hypothetical protein